jgi:hypothetical protein
VTVAPTVAAETVLHEVGEGEHRRREQRGAAQPARDVDEPRRAAGRGFARVRGRLVPARQVAAEVQQLDVVGDFGEQRAERAPFAVAVRRRDPAEGAVGARRLQQPEQQHAVVVRIGEQMHQRGRMQRLAPRPRLQLRLAGEARPGGAAQAPQQRRVEVAARARAFGGELGEVGDGATADRFEDRARALTHAVHQRQVAGRLHRRHALMVPVAALTAGVEERSRRRRIGGEHAQRRLDLDRGGREVGDGEAFLATVLEDQGAVGRRPALHLGEQPRVEDDLHDLVAARPARRLDVDDFVVMLAEGARARDLAQQVGQAEAIAVLQHALVDQRCAGAKQRDGRRGPGGEVALGIARLVDAERGDELALELATARGGELLPRMRRPPLAAILVQIEGHAARALEVAVDVGAGESLQRGRILTRQSR